jgi:hypothetical protein
MSKWTRRLLFATPVLLLAGVAGAPYLSADIFKEQIRVNLERVLHRKVELDGEARFQLYPRPGVSLSHVVIHELPELGVEPIAYLGYPGSSLDVSLSPVSLLVGKIRVTGVRLVAPSLNIMKTPDGAWNVQPLLDQAMGEDLDALEVQGGRLNIKIGNVKSVFYLNDADLRIEVDSSNRNRYGITIEGDPARTDRTVSSFGRLSGRGMLTLGRGGAEPQINLSLSIDRTPISEIVMALEGRSGGLGGFVASQAKLSGPLSEVSIEGRLDLNEADRFGWLFPRTSRGIGYTGRLDWVNQELRLSTRDAEAGADPVSVRMRAFDLFRHPKWAALLGINQTPLASVRALAGEFGINLPSETPMEGSLSGVLGYSSLHGTRGQLEISQAAVPVPKVPAATLTTARVLVDNHRWKVPAAEIRFSEREALTVETAGDASSGAREVAVASAGLGVERSRQLWKFLAGGTDPPFFDRCGQGQWSGAIRFVQDSQGAGAWSGDVRVVGAVCTLEGIAAPAIVDSAQVSIRGGTMLARRVAVRVGELELTGEVDHDPRLRRHTRLRVAAVEASAGEIERLLLPSIRRERGFFSRTLGRRTPLPEWLSRRRLDAQIRVAILTAGEQRAEGVDAHLAWDGEVIEVPQFHAALMNGAVNGRFRISIAEAEPSYRGHFEFNDVALREGRIDGAADWETAGAGVARLLSTLQAQGRFSVEGNPLLAADPPCEAVSGAFTFGGSRFQLTNLQVTSAGESWQGHGNTGPDGRVQLDLTAGSSTARQLRAAGRLW